MKIKFMKGGIHGTVADTHDVNTADPEAAKGEAIRRLARLRGENKADSWVIVNEIDKTIKTSEDDQ
jgi:hypothetical protein